MSRFWSFAQLSEKYQSLRPVDQVLIRGPGKLFIGGLKALDDIDGLNDASITHILSVLEFDYCDRKELDNFTRLLVQVDDDPHEDLIKHFSSTNAFLEKASENGDNVLVHCAMGVSRSATVVCAYLMYKQKLSSEKALALLREARPLCTPNPGFKEQLSVYERMLKQQTEAGASKLCSEWVHMKDYGPKL